VIKGILLGLGLFLDDTNMSDNLMMLCGAALAGGVLIAGAGVATAGATGLVGYVAWHEASHRELVGRGEVEIFGDDVPYVVYESRTFNVNTVQFCDGGWTNCRSVEDYLRQEVGEAITFIYDEHDI